MNFMLGIRISELKILCEKIVRVFDYYYYYYYYYWWWKIYFSWWCVCFRYSQLDVFYRKIYVIVIKFISLFVGLFIYKYTFVGGLLGKNSFFCVYVYS